MLCPQGRTMCHYKQLIFQLCVHAGGIWTDRCLDSRYPLAPCAVTAESMKPIMKQRCCCNECCERARQASTAAYREIFSSYYQAAADDPRFSELENQHRQARRERQMVLDLHAHCKDVRKTETT